METLASSRRGDVSSSGARLEACDCVECRPCPNAAVPGGTRCKFCVHELNVAARLRCARSYAIASRKVGGARENGFSAPDPGRASSALSRTQRRRLARKRRSSHPGKFVPVS